ncbi:hypothetical protein GYMLUDRAFT_65343 [Collybiopsis luxurians FD-317 M1]|uniref:F-box domain-containing protein n=1 Tax=Collybiopsis luxurians FD-317 M1 TaxID=944289 RepID=A0A0D0C6E0_9AGAR|nr:hypothetical protein GYMLUDRAFT_65343 [Collybiopsis luxurians FD-317 M1]
MHNDLKQYSCGMVSIILSVCYRWHLIAVNCPELWSQLSLDLCTEYQYDNWYNSVMTKLALLYLEHSGHHPLLLSFNSIPWKYSIDGCANHPLLQKLSDQSAQWKHVSFSLAEYPLQEFPAWIDLDLPGLESFALRVEANEQAWALAVMLQNFLILCYISSSNANLIWDETLLIDVQELHYNVDCWNFYNIVSQFSKLVELHVGNASSSNVSESFKLSTPLQL